MAKTNTVLKYLVNKLFTVKNTYDTNQADKAREQNSIERVKISKIFSRLIT